MKDVNIDHGERFEFNENVTKVFDDMLRRSIPSYARMRELVFLLGRHFVRKGDTILDIGCSRGDAMEPFIKEFGDFCYYMGIDVSEPMVSYAQDRFRHCAKYVDVIHMDLREEFPKTRNCLTLSILTLQFIPINYRQQILYNIYTHTVKDGALILVEKTLGNSAHLDSLIQEEYHNFKNAQGYSLNEIERKKMALEGVLVPMTARMNEEFLIGAGFSQVDCVWRDLPFAMWLCIK